MSEFFSQLFSFLTGVWLLVLGIISNEPIVVSDQAATLTLSGGDTIEEFTEPAEYVSLFDVIVGSLEKIKDEINGNGKAETSNEEELEVEIATSTAKTTNNLGEAIVNIVCIQKTDTYKRTASGTGFVISSNGVIMTNAHVAQFLLLETAKELGEADCQVRVGQDNKTAYEVELLYISPTWLLEHADFINTVSPRGTGENDFALLHITEAVNDYELPDTFAYLPPSTNPLSKSMIGNTVILVGYPSGEKAIGTRTVATTSITNLYTFGSGYADIVSLSASDLGQHGSSGGPVIDNLGRSIGIITTKDTSSTALNAITLSHVDRTLKSETGYDLVNTISGDLGYRAKLFGKTISPILSEILAAEAVDASALLDD